MNISGQGHRRNIGHLAGASREQEMGHLASGREDNQTVKFQETQSYLEKGM